MGRKARFAGEEIKKGPGRKAKKQRDPIFHKSVSEDSENKTLSHRQKQRAQKRQKKQNETKEKKNILKIKSKEKKSRINNPGKNDSVENDTFELSNKAPKVMLKTFSDENKSWLKPKSSNKHSKVFKKSASIIEENSESSDENINLSNLNDLESEIEDDEYDCDDLNLSDNSSDNDKDNTSTGSNNSFNENNDLLPIEKANKQLKKKEKKERKLAEAEFKDSIANQDVFDFPSEEELQQSIGLPEIQQRIKDITTVLANFNKLKAKERSRSEYIDLLQKDLITYYSYNEFLMKKLMELFSLTELIEFLEASEVQRPVTIRTNGLKTRRRELAHALINRGVNLDPVGNWTKVGLVIYSSSVPIGATPEYLAGHYIIQGASSLLPVMALDPQPNERILDMCSAPGGKASHIASLMRNTGVLFANDINKDRINAVIGNFHRLGVSNSIVCSYDGRKFPSVITGFDRVLLDAPCSGTGVIAKDPSIKTSKDESDIQRCFTLQRQLLLAAIDCLNAKSSTGGCVVYSTCSILPEENECVVDYVLKKRNVKLIPTGLEFGVEGFVNYRQHRFHPTMNLTRRFYPHKLNMDGFFVAKFIKFSNNIPKTIDDDKTDSLNHKIENMENDKILKRHCENDPNEHTNKKQKKIQMNEGVVNSNVNKIKNAIDSKNNFKNLTKNTTMIKPNIKKVARISSNTKISSGKQKEGKLHTSNKKYANGFLVTDLPEKLQKKQQ